MAGTKRIAVLAAGLMLAGPAVGAAPQHVLCSEADNPDLDIHVEALAVEIINHEASDTELAAETAEGKDILIRARTLEPLAEAAIRDAFEAEEETEAQPEEPEPALINARLPGVSDDRLIHFRKQMFRRDI